MTVIEQIKAEIERRIEHHDSLASNAESEMIANLEIGAAQALDDILPFLSTLESEKPLGLEEEIKRYYDDMDGDCRYAQTARHFAECGYLRAAEKYNEIEYNRQRAEESGGFEISNGSTINEPIDGVLYAAACGIKNATVKSEKPIIPNDLEKAAIEYAKAYTKNDNGNGGDDWEDDIKITFIAGAKWGAEHLKK